MTDPQSEMINIGTAENPYYIPQKAIESPLGPRGNEWWESVANGSVLPTIVELDRALELSQPNIDEPQNS